MLCIRRAVVDIAQKSFRQNCRLNSSTPKPFKPQNRAANAQFVNKNSEQNYKYVRKESKQEREETQKQQREEEEEEEQQQHFHDEATQKQLAIQGQFKQISHKNRETFLSMVNMFVHRDKHRRHHVEFIYASLKYMKEFGVERDMEIYKAILDVMPKGKFIARNVFQAEFMHYPKQQDCAIYLLDQMEYNALMPDDEVEAMIENIFGNRCHPMYKLWRMKYWMPKFKFLSPWLLPDPVPNDPLELAKLAVRQMCTVDVESVVDVLDTESVKDSLDKTWIVSGQSPEQKELLAKHSVESALRVEGPFFLQLRNRSITYFTLIGEPEPDDNFAPEEDLDDVRNIPMPKFMKFMSPDKEVVVQKPQRSIHQQDDGTIYAICATGTSTKDSLLSWIRLLEVNGNPSLQSIPVLFQFKSNVNDSALVVVTDENPPEKNLTL